MHTPDNPVLVDLYCGEGGAARGYVRSGFAVHGVDSNPQVKDRYLRSGAVSFMCRDATDISDLLETVKPDAVHASPPCKEHTELATLSGGDDTGWMLPHTIRALRAWGGPWVVENVAGARAHMDGAMTLCGASFGLTVSGRVLKRHRLFLSNVPMMAPPCVCSGKPIIGVYGTGGGGQMTRGYKANPAEARTVMEMPWASRDGCAQAIPPAYTEYIGWHLRAACSLRA